MTPDSYLQVTEYALPTEGLAREVRVLLISDLHIMVSEADSTAEYKAHVQEMKRAWEPVRKDFARLSGDSATEEHLLPPEEGLPRFIAYANGLAPDGVVFAGDMLEEYSRENLNCFSARLKELRVPWLWVRGNHERGDGGALSPYFQGGKAVQVLDVGGLRIIGLDNAEKKVGKDAVAEAWRLKTKASVLALHLPLLTPGNREEAACLGEYFLMREEDDPALFAALERDPFQAVLCGHLHRKYFGGYCKEGVQLCTSSAMVGACTFVRFTPKNKE